MTPAKTILVLLLATTMGLTLVWQASRRRRTGYRLNDLEGAIAEQRVQRESYRTDVSTLRNPARLLALVERYGLNLQPPEPAAADSPVQTGETDITPPLTPEQP
jgi:cell division protein FtsL